MCFSILILIFLSLITEHYMVTNQMIDICHSSSNKIYVPVGTNNFISTKKTNKIVSLCRVQLISCPACVIYLKIWLFDLNKQNGREVNTSSKISCVQNCLQISEPVYKAYTKKQYCNENRDDFTNATPPFTYLSQTRGVTITFTYDQEYEYPFKIEFIVKYNIQQIEVYPNIENLNSMKGTISTPFFPIQYPSDLRFQFNIKCLPKIPEICRIRLMFTDHHIASASILEFFDDKNRKIGATTGRIFRPPIIVSNGPILLINFHANRASSFGFKANYSIILGDKKESFLKFKTTCGGFADDYGGTIIMTYMTNNENISYDCIWIIRPMLKYNINTRTHLYLKLVTFTHMDYNTELRIHEGLTSSHRLIQHIIQNSTNLTYVRNEEHTTNINTGFYVWLRGSFSIKSQFAISYTAFSFSHSHQVGEFHPQESLEHDCYAYTDFLCHNFRCIDGRLHCDGFDHCGDNSDELECTYDEKEDEKSRTYLQRYYFPLFADTYPSLPAGFFIAFCISFVAFLFCSLFCSAVYKIKRQCNINDRLHIHNELEVQQDSQNWFNSENGFFQESPPEYDFPPDYYDVMVYNTMKRVMLNSKNVQNVAMQTESNEVMRGCCSSSSSFKVGRSNNQTRLYEDNDLNSNAMVRNAEFSYKNLHNVKSRPIYQSISLCGTELNDESNCNKTKTDVWHSNLLSKNTNNFISSLSAPNLRVKDKRYSKSLEKLNSKSKSNNVNVYYYEKLINKQIYEDDG